MGFTLGVCGHTPASLPSHAASRILCRGHLRSKTWSLFERSQPIPFHLMEFPTSIVEPFFPPLQGFWAKALFGDWIKGALEDLEIPGEKRQTSQSVKFQWQMGKGLGLGQWRSLISSFGEIFTPCNLQVHFCMLFFVTKSPFQTLVCSEGCYFRCSFHHEILHPRRSLTVHSWKMMIGRQSLQFWDG